MLSLLAKYVVSSSLAFLGSLFALLSLAALLRVCRRPIVKLPAATLVVLSIFAVISAGVADKMRGSGKVRSEGLSPCVPRYDGTGEQGSQPRTIPDSMPRLPDACDVGEDEGFVGMPCVSNLTVAAILRGSNETANVVAWHPSFRPLGDLVDFYGGTNLTDFARLFTLDVAQCASNALVVVSDEDVSGMDSNTQAFFAVGDATDTDGDCLFDSEERFVYKTNADNADTDSDGLDDGEEVALGISPCLPDSDEDGFGDGEETGWIRRADGFEWYDSEGWRTEYGCDPYGWLNGNGIGSPMYPSIFSSLAPQIAFYDTSLTWMFAYHCGYVSFFASGNYAYNYDPWAPSPLNGWASNYGNFLVVPYWMLSDLEIGNTNSFMRYGYVASNGVHVVEYRNLKKYGTDLGVTMQVIVPTDSNRTVRISYLCSDFWLDGDGAVVGVQNKDIVTTNGYYNLTFDFAKFGPILPQTTWEYRLGYATNPISSDTDGDGLSDDFEIGVSHSDPLSIDGDGDGLTDVQEYAIGTNPKLSDSDGDLLPDGWEILYALNPLSAEGDNGRLGDIDNDGLANWQEYRNGTNPRLADTDNDGLSDSEELSLGTNPCLADTDGDGISDAAELSFGTNPSLADTDGDGLSDGVELGYGDTTGIGTDPLLKDTDGDCLPDGWENANDLDPLSDIGDDGADGDPDEDGLSNFTEYAVGANPQSSYTFSPDVGDSTYVGYGMCAFPPLNGVEVSISVGDPSGSHSERWKMTLEEEGGFGRRYQIVCNSYGTVNTSTVVLELGRHYIGRIEHLATNGMLADYDWMAQIDGLPTTKVMSPVRERWTCIADKLVMIDNESGLLGSCDQSFGTENYAEDKHFDVYTVSVWPTNVKFNWNPDSSVNDAINLRCDYNTPYNISNGEYTPSYSYPVCYVTNVVPMVKAKFRVVPEAVSSLELDAVLNGTLLSDLGATTVSFTSGESGYADFTMSGAVASVVGLNASNSYAWRVRAINGVSLSSPISVASTGPHKTYVILGEPVEPWSNEPNVRNNAWSTALDLTCQWASGCETWQSAATGITQSIFESGRFAYDTRKGAPRYISNEGWLFVEKNVFFGAAIDRLNGGLGRGPRVNCSDCAAMVCSFANLVGCGLYASRMEPSGFFDSWFATNPYCAIGCADWIPPSWGWGFSFHEVAWSGNCGDSDLVFDACVKVDGDASPGVLPYMKVLPAALIFCDGNPGAPIVYKEMLTPDSPDGYQKCVPAQSEKTRRSLR